MRLRESSGTCTSGNDCSHWYAVQTTTGHEKKLISTIRSVYQKQINLYLPVKEMIHRLKGMEYIAQLPLFPGYIFVHKDIDPLVEALHNANSKIFAKPVKANGKYLEASEREMRFLFDITGTDGVIKVSRGVISEDSRIQILSGPLKDFRGKILFINKRKSKARVSIDIMNKNLEVSLGLDIIRPDPAAETPALIRPGHEPAADVITIHKSF